MADEQAATNDDDHFVKPKIPFRKPLVDLSGKLEHKVITSTPVFKTPTSNQPQTSGQESAPKKIPNALTQIKPPKKVFYLEEIKDGTVCKRHYLNNNINTLGEFGSWSYLGLFGKLVNRFQLISTDLINYSPLPHHQVVPPTVT